MNTKTGPSFSATELFIMVAVTSICAFMVGMGTMDAEWKTKLLEKKMGEYNSQTGNFQLITLTNYTETINK